MARIELHEWYRQFQQLKAQSPNAILLYRMGDFYEAFDDDAKLVAQVLDLTLTRKDYASEKTPKGQRDQKHYCPMAGIPYHAVDSYVKRLIERGYRVAIAEQISETASSKSDTRPRSAYASAVNQSERQRGLAHREIVRVLTPGTVIDPAMLDASQNNYLAAVIAAGEGLGLAYVDLTTGEFAATELHGERAAMQLEGELARLQVAEVLVPADEAARPASLTPGSARLSHDLAPLTKEERERLPRHERIARPLENENSSRWAQGRITTLPAWHWELNSARDALMQQLGVQSLAGFGLQQRPLAARAAGAIVTYVRDTQRSSATQITTLRVYTTGSFMFLDPQTRRNLELLESSSQIKARSTLLNVLDQTRTPMGARLLRRWLAQPLLDRDALHARQEAIACCVDDGMLRAALRQALGEVGDMERSLNRIVQSIGFATPRDLVQLRQALRALPAVAEAVHERAALLYEHRVEQQISPPEEQEPPRRGRGAPRVTGDELFDDDDAELDDLDDAADLGAPDAADAADAAPAQAAMLDTCGEVLRLLEEALDDDPPALLGASNYLRVVEAGSEPPRRFIRPGFDPDMDTVIKASQDAQQWIDRLEGRERERTGIKSLKVSYNKVFGYYIEVSRAQSDEVPTHYERKQTLVGAERFITAELKEYETVVQNAQQRLAELERDAFLRICGEVARFAARLRHSAHTLARLDVAAALAEAAVRGGYVRPTLSDSTRLEIRGGRHPVVERMLPDTFVANDTCVDTEEQQILLVTGPNMAGKSSLLRQVALIVLLAQIGAYVPAESAEVGLVDRIFTRIGAQDDIATGQSTFMVEMTETAALLVQSTRRSLIILDEVGRGTSTYDGMAIARAVVEYIHNEPRLQCRTLFATHYHELTALEELLPRVHNYHMAAVEREGRVVFLYELRRGGADRSYGIHVAELAGIPRSVLRRASELLAELEQHGHINTLAPAQSAAPEQPAASAERAASAAPQPPAGAAQLSLFDVAPNPVVEYLKRLNINELTPIEAMTRLYELQKLAQKPLDEQ